MDKEDVVYVYIHTHTQWGSSLEVQWLGLSASTALASGSIPGQ